MTKEKKLAHWSIYHSFLTDIMYDMSSDLLLVKLETNLIAEMDALRSQNPIFFCKFDYFVIAIYFCDVLNCNIGYLVVFQGVVILSFSKNVSCFS